MADLFTFTAANRDQADYVDDHALAQILGALTLLGLLLDQQMMVTRGDDSQMPARMILLQKISVQSAQDQKVVRFRYAQSKIDTAPGTILVDREVSAVIEGQQRWVRQHLPNCSGNSATSRGSPTAKAGNYN